MIPLPISLVGNAVRLDPLSEQHTNALVDIGLAESLWEWIPTPIHSADDMRRYVDKALKEQRLGVALPFVIVDRLRNEVIGCTRYGNIDQLNKRLEIGWSWVTPQYQRTVANTEAKYLLLAHAFEHLGVHRVEFKTDALNERSRSAIRRLGAVEEGIFRKHLITSSGRVRDTVYYSIIDTEWPTVRANLCKKMEARGADPENGTPDTIRAK